MLYIAKLFRKLDTFGVGVNFLIDKEEKHKTLTGAFCTVLCSMVILAYAAFLTFNMVTYSSTNFSSSTAQNFYSQTDFYFPVNN